MKRSFNLVYIVVYIPYGSVSQQLKHVPQVTENMYNGYGKYSEPLTFFTLCSIAAIC